jgi:hypothetical protein
MQRKSHRAGSRGRGFVLPIRNGSKLLAAAVLTLLVCCSRNPEPSDPAGSGGGSGGASGGQDCGSCVDGQCRSEMLACAEDTLCEAILQCSDTCATGYRPCIETCITSTPNGTANRPFKNFLGCVTSKCQSDCRTSMRMPPGASSVANPRESHLYCARRARGPTARSRRTSP